MSAAHSTGEPGTSRSLAATVEQASDYLRRFRDVPLGHFIGGKAERGASKELFDNVSPVDGRVLGQIVAGNEQDVNAAANAAKAAFPAWRAAPW